MAHLCQLRTQRASEGSTLSSMLSSKDSDLSNAFNNILRDSFKRKVMRLKKKHNSALETLGSGRTTIGMRGGAKRGQSVHRL